MAHSVDAAGQIVWQILRDCEESEFFCSVKCPHPPIPGRLKGVQGYFIVRAYSQVTLTITKAGKITSARAINVSQSTLEVDIRTCSFNQE